MTPTKDGFVIHFTAPINKNIKAEDFVKALSMESWYYANTGKYGSPSHDKRKEEITSAKFQGSNQSVAITVKDFSKKRSIDRLHYFKINTDGMFKAPAWKTLEAYYTLRELP